MHWLQPFPRQQSVDASDFHEDDNHNIDDDDDVDNVYDDNDDYNDNDYNNDNDDISIMMIRMIMIKIMI